MQSVRVALIPSPNKRTSASHLERENIQFKEMQEQRKSLLTLNTNVRMITLKIVNHCLAGIPVEKFSPDTNHKEPQRIALKEQSWGVVYTKLFISVA